MNIRNKVLLCTGLSLTLFYWGNAAKFARHGYKRKPQQRFSKKTSHINLVNTIFDKMIKGIETKIYRKKYDAADRNILNKKLKDRKNLIRQEIQTFVRGLKNKKATDHEKSIKDYIKNRIQFYFDKIKINAWGTYF